MQAALKEIVALLSPHVVVCHCIGRKGLIAEELECDGRIHHIIIVGVSMFRSEDRLRCAKPNEASICSFEYAGVVVVTETSPLRFTNIAL